MRLSNANLAALPAGVAKPAYDRAGPCGIVHFGIGAFHRAHLAAYADACLAAGEAGWMITGVSLRSGDVAAQLNPQDGLFSLTERSAAGAQTRVIGAVQRVLVASEDAAAVVAAIAAPATQIISFTVTEKGYCRAVDGSLDLALARSGSFYPLLAAGIRARRQAGLGALTLLSCDNLAENGAQLQRLMGEYLAAEAPDVLGWFAAECRCPSTMVDRIVPATTPANLAEIAATLGLRDEAAVVTESFSQLIIQDNFAGPRPLWEAHGAELVGDVRPYEAAKLRMLNGAHSLLAYVGMERGYVFVHEAISDPEVALMVRHLMLEEAAPSLTPAPGQDLEIYAENLLARFANPALEHRLSQIAMDGSQKIPQRWLETLAFHQWQGRQCPAIYAGIAAWLRHVRGGGASDPLAEKLAACWVENGAQGFVKAVFSPNGIVPSRWVPNAAETALIGAQLHL